MRKLIEAGRLDTVHDVSDGGLIVTLAEMAMAGKTGAKLGAHDIAFWFGEDQARYVLAVPEGDAARILSDAKTAGVPALLLGTAGGDKIAVDGSGDVALKVASQAHESWFPRFMGASELPPTN